jgi:hypothetical protein
MLSLYEVHEEGHILQLLINADDEGFRSRRYGRQSNHVIPSGNCFQISSMGREITVSLLLLSVVEMVQMRQDERSKSADLPHVPFQVGNVITGTSS